MRIKIALILALVLTVSAAGWGGSAAARVAGLGSSGANYGITDLEADALQSLRDSYALLIDGSIDPARLKLVGNIRENGQTQTVGERSAAIGQRRSGNLRYGLVFTSADVSLRDVAVERRGQQVLLHATEVVWLSFQVNHRGARPEDRMAEAFPHEFVFEYLNGRWTLTLDRVLWPAPPAPKDPNAPPIDFPTLSDLRSSLPSREGSAPRLLSPVAASGSYNVSGAVNHAVTYWGPTTNEYDHYYKFFADPANDCTNFASQNLAAGGWTAKGGWYLDPNVWWYDASNATNSNTWSVADWLLPFINNSGRGYSVAAFTDLQLGDVMFADWAYNGLTGRPEHSLIVTTKLSNDYADIRFTYHSVNRLNKPLSDILAENPGSQYWGTHIQFTSN